MVAELSSVLSIEASDIIMTGINLIMYDKGCISNHPILPSGLYLLRQVNIPPKIQINVNHCPAELAVSYWESVWPRLIWIHTVFIKSVKYHS